VKQLAAGGESPLESDFRVLNTGRRGWPCIRRTAISSHVRWEETREDHNTRSTLGLLTVPMYVAERSFEGLANRGLGVPAHRAGANGGDKTIGLGARIRMGGIRTLRCLDHRRAGLSRYRRRLWRGAPYESRGRQD